MAEMTPQKALKILEMFLHKQCDLQRTDFAYSQREVYMAVSMAQNALEKPPQEITEQDKSLTLVFGKDGKATILNEDYVIYCADEETFEKVKKAVEKQIPKKPILKETKCFDDSTADFVFVCPVCNRAICREPEDDVIADYIKEEYPHCNCGHALDWSDTE